MLHNVLLRGVAAAAFTLLAGTSAQAQTQSVEDILSTVSEEDRARFETLTMQLQQEAVRGVQNPSSPARAAVDAINRRVDDIANEDMAKEREKVMRFLGIDPESEHALYVFVSWSMPLDMLRSYVVEAMWAGATLVFRGVPPDRTLAQFFTEDLRQLIWDKGASAAISLDPRLYDAYGVKMVPTVVLTRTRDNFVCADAGSRTVRIEGGRTASYDLCPSVDADQYIKMAGAITVDFALDTFKARGFDEAELYLNALRRGYPPGQTASKEQKPYTGEWADALSPEDLMKAEAAKAGMALGEVPPMSSKLPGQ